MTSRGTISLCKVVFRKKEGEGVFVGCGRYVDKIGQTSDNRRGGGAGDRFRGARGMSSGGDKENNNEKTPGQINAGKKMISRVVVAKT